MIYQVHEFHAKFGLPTGKTDLLMSGGEEAKLAAEFRIKFMQEELDEFVEAYARGDKVKAFDALLDLAYVVYGTALFMGIDPFKWTIGMLAVHDANMRKIRVESSDQSKRGSKFDVVKPKGWESPEPHLEELLRWDR